MIDNTRIMKLSEYVLLFPSWNSVPYLKKLYVRKRITLHVFRNAQYKSVNRTITTVIHNTHLMPGSSIPVSIVNGTDVKEDQFFFRSP